MTFFTY